MGTNEHFKGFLYYNYRVHVGYHIWCGEVRVVVGYRIDAICFIVSKSPQTRITCNLLHVRG